MINSLQAIILGLLQGAFELFPVSSLGHSVIFPQLFGWNIHENDNAFLVFLVATHLATALVLVGFYWKTWLNIAKALWRTLRTRQLRGGDVEARLGWLLVAGTIPAGILGFVFEKPIRNYFVSARSAAFFLILNGILLLGAEVLRKRAKRDGSTSGLHARLAKLSWWQAIKVGAVQTLALIPGFSRSGSSMAGGLMVGLSNEDAAHFSFLLATPIIFGAALKKLPDLFKPENAALLTPSILGALCAAVSAYLTVRFLTKYFHTNSLKPFGIYCLVAGLLTSILFALQ